MGTAPAARLPRHPLPALRMACQAIAGGSQPPDRSGWTDPEKLEAMAARLLAAKQAGASRSADGAGGQPGPRATAPSGPARPSNSSGATKPAASGYGGPVAQDLSKRPNPLALLVGSAGQWEDWKCRMQLVETGIRHSPCNMRKLCSAPDLDSAPAPAPTPVPPQGQALLFILLLPFRLAGGILRAAFVLLEVAFKTALLLVQIPIFVIATCEPVVVLTLMAACAHAWRHCPCLRACHGAAQPWRH